MARQIVVEFADDDKEGQVRYMARITSYQREARRSPHAKPLNRKAMLIDQDEWKFLIKVERVEDTHEPGPSFGGHSEEPADGDNE